MKLYTHILVLIAATCVTLTTAAQDDNNDKEDRTIVVEKEYNPDINDANKINTLPKTEKTAVRRSDPQFATEQHALQSNVPFRPMRIANIPPEAKQAQMGHAHAGYGMGNTLDAAFYIAPRNTGNHRIAFEASIDGWNRDLHPFEHFDKNDETVWHARYYKSDFKLNYNYQFDALNLYVKGGYGLDCFNYGLSANSSSNEQDKQSHNKGDIAFGIRSNSAERWLYSTEIAYKTFKNEFGSQGYNPDTEHIFAAKGNIGFAFDQQTLLDLRIDAAHFSHQLSDINDYTTLSLNPYVRTGKENWRLKLGFNADFAFGDGETFNISPDVRLDFFVNNKVNIYLNGTGGRVASDYRSLNNKFPYLDPSFLLPTPAWTTRIKPVDNYNTADLSIGVKTTPANEFSLDLSGGYSLNKGDIWLTSLPFDADETPYWNIAQSKTSRFYATAHIEYTFKDIIRINAQTTYNKWNTTNECEQRFENNERYLLEFKPVSETNVTADAKIIDNLFFNLSYTNIVRKKNTACGNINDLSARVSYTFFKGLGVYVSAKNLLGQDNMLYVNCPSQPFTLLGGLSYRF